MSFAAPTPAPRVRPSTVNLAVNLLFAAAAIEVISVIIALLYAGKIADASQKALEGTSQANASSAATTTITVAVGLLIAVLFAVLAVFVGKGKQIARILTWVVGGIALCCTVGGVGFSFLGEAGWDEARKNDPDLPTWDQYNELIYADVPGWYQPVTMILTVLMVLAVIVAIILLALPASHPYFRAQPQQEWEPPVPGSPGDTPPPPPAGPTTP